MGRRQFNQWLPNLIISTAPGCPHWSAGCLKGCQNELSHLRKNSRPSAKDVRRRWIPLRVLWGLWNLRVCAGPRKLEKSRAKPKTSSADECQNAGKARQTADHYQLLFLRQSPSRGRALANHHPAVALTWLGLCLGLHPKPLGANTAEGPNSGIKAAACVRVLGIELCDDSDRRRNDADLAEPR